MITPRGSRFASLDGPKTPGSSRDALRPSGDIAEGRSATVTGDGPVGCYRTKGICAYPACGGLTTERYCGAHRSAARPNAHQRGYRRDWRRYSTTFRQDYPLCGMGPRWPTPKLEGAPAGCLAKRKLAPGGQVDHIVPVRRDRNLTLFWDPMNHQNLCRPCHMEKTRREPPA